MLKVPDVDFIVPCGDVLFVFVCLIVSWICVVVIIIVVVCSLCVCLWCVFFL